MNKLYKMRTVVFIVVVLIVSAALFNLVTISEVECYVGQKKASRTVCDHFKPLYGKSFFFTNFESEEVVQNLHVQDSESGSYYLASISKQFPDKISIFLIDEPPVYRFVTKEVGKYLINRQGQIKNDNDSLDLAEVKGFFSDESFTSMDLEDQSTHLFLVNLVESLEEEKVPFSSIEQMSESEIFIFLPNGLKAITDLSQQPNVDAKKLAIVLLELDSIASDTSESEDPPSITAIDLRFRYPVLR